jgi:dimethylargininase
MLAQHDAYLHALTSLGVSITLAEADPRFPDGYFVEDAAVVTDDCAVMTRSGARSRRGEGEALEPLLAAERELFRIEAPGTVDGGDVIVADDRVLVGLSARTNGEGAAQLAAILGPRGMHIETVPVAGGLHLKSDVNHLGGDRLIVTSAYANRHELAGFERLVVPPGEEYAANCICLGRHAIVAAGYARTHELLERAGFRTLALEVGEFRKMDGGLTCLSIRL